MHFAFLGIKQVGRGTARAIMFLALASFILSGFPDPTRADEQYSTLTISNKNGTRSQFLVELMETPQERAQGLMFRKHLGEDQGMLFDFGKSDEVHMWMKNTFISLDMIFIREDGIIHRIEKNTEPHSLRTVASKGPVLGVLEIPAGTSVRLSLRPGDKVEHPMFGTE